MRRFWLILSFILTYLTLHPLFDSVSDWLAVRGWLGIWRGRDILTSSRVFGITIKWHSNFQFTLFNQVKCIEQLDFICRDKRISIYWMTMYVCQPLRFGLRLTSFQSSHLKLDRLNESKKRSFLKWRHCQQSKIIYKRNHVNKKILKLTIVMQEVLSQVNGPFVHWWPPLRAEKSDQKIFKTLQTRNKTNQR